MRLIALERTLDWCLYAYEIDSNCKISAMTILIQNIPRGYLVVYFPPAWKKISDIPDDLEICYVAKSLKSAEKYLQGKIRCVYEIVAV